MIEKTVHLMASKSKEENQEGSWTKIYPSKAQSK
jgi:hypothetical protein